MLCGPLDRICHRCELVGHTLEMGLRGFPHAKVLN
jgi:hypothetical protein